MLKVRVNPIQCVAHGLCAELLPERITLDEWAYPILDGSALPAELVKNARRAGAAVSALASVVVGLSAPNSMGQHRSKCGAAGAGGWASDHVARRHARAPTMHTRV